MPRDWWRRARRTARVFACAASLLTATASAQAAGDANTGKCPNEMARGFQAYLPDCRAYELVTPPFTAGQTSHLNALSPDGSHVLDTSLGGVAGTEAESSGDGTADYNLVREPSGWEVSAIAPAASEFPIQRLVAASGDLSRSLWELRRPSQSIYAMDFYLRDADGSLTLVGPALPPSAAAGPPAGGSQSFFYERASPFAGASSDLSHAFFELNSIFPVLWPRDTTHSAFSLYGINTGPGSQSPYLVGADAEGQLVSDCGTSLGSGRVGDHDNAISAGGDTVYFTANAATAGCTGPPVNELYARVGQEVVPLSEPSAPQCRQCQVGGPKGSADFAGASEDGSRAFFLTGQELLPGATGQNIYEYDFTRPEGERVVRVSNGAGNPGVLGVARVSGDGSHVYFVATGVLTRAPRGGGCLPALSASELLEEEVTKEGRCRAKNGADNLYLFEEGAAHPDGHVRFISTLPVSDSQDWELVDHRPVQTTGSGQFIVLQSTAGLLPGETSAKPQIFEYDAREETLQRVSIGQAGYAGGTASADAFGAAIQVPEYASSYSPTARATHLAVSEDGATVVFQSAGALTPGSEDASNAGATSVYEYHSAGPITDGNVFLVSNGHNTASALVLGIDLSGQDIYFETSEPLVAEDVDTQFAIYDARVDGGFPARVVPAGCEASEGGCLSGALAVPSFAAPGSASAPGAGNATSSPAVKTLAESKTRPKAKTKPLTRAQQRARELRACKRHRGKRRATCEARVMRRYHAAPPTKPTAKR